MELEPQSVLDNQIWSCPICGRRVQVNDDYTVLEKGDMGVQHTTNGAVPVKPVQQVWLDAIEELDL
jgi:hypothetical protein